MLAANVPTTTDLFHIVITNGNSISQGDISGLNIFGNGGARGRHAFFFDCGFQTTAVYFNLNFHDNIIAVMNTGDSLNATGIASNANGCFAWSDIHNNHMVSIFLSFAGDSIGISENQLWSNAGNTRNNIDFSQVLGSGNLKIYGNNISNSASAIHLRSALDPQIFANELEWGNPDVSVNHAQIDIDGSVATVDKAVINLNSAVILGAAGNGPNLSGSSGGPDVIRLNFSTAALIDGNVLSVFNSVTAPGGSHIALTSNANTLPLTYVGGGNTWRTITGGPYNVPRVYDLAGRSWAQFTSAFTAPSVHTVLHGDPTYNTGAFGALTLADMAAPNAVGGFLSATAPAIASGFCTSPSITAANGTAAFDILVGSACGASIGTLTMPTATTGWVCQFHDVTTPASNVVEQTGGTVSTVTLTNYVRTTGVAGNFSSNDHVRGECTAY